MFEQMKLLMGPPKRSIRLGRGPSKHRQSKYPKDPYRCAESGTGLFSSVPEPDSKLEWFDIKQERMMAILAKKNTKNLTPTLPPPIKSCASHWNHCKIMNLNLSLFSSILCPTFFYILILLVLLNWFALFSDRQKSCFFLRRFWVKTFSIYIFFWRPAASHF